MGTSNFAYRNASKCFAVFMQREEELEGETITTYPSEWEVEDDIEYFKSELSHDKFYAVDCDEWDNNRSYPARLIKAWWANKTFAGVTVEICLTAKLVSGYYEGACFDWTIAMFVDNCEYDAFDITDFKSHCEYNAGVVAFTYPKLDKWIESTKQKMIEDMEAIFDQLSEVKLKRVATFSNGETIYEKIN